METADNSGFERWFNVVQRAPEAAGELAAAFETLTDGGILDLLREAGGEVSGQEWGWSS